jgi:multisubunit Na+/H+ antiporter MnhG subunit
MLVAPARTESNKNASVRTPAARFLRATSTLFTNQMIAPLLCSGPVISAVASIGLVKLPAQSRSVDEVVTWIVGIGTIVIPTTLVVSYWDGATHIWDDLTIAKILSPSKAVWRNWRVFVATIDVACPSLILYQSIAQGGLVPEPKLNRVVKSISTGTFGQPMYRDVIGWRWINSASMPTKSCTDIVTVSKIALSKSLSWILK